MLGCYYTLSVLLHSHLLLHSLSYSNRQLSGSHSFQNWFWSVWLFFWFSVWFSVLIFQSSSCSNCLSSGAVRSQVIETELCTPIGHKKTIVNVHNRWCNFLNTKQAPCLHLPLVVCPLDVITEKSSMTLPYKIMDDFVGEYWLKNEKQEKS